MDREAWWATVYGITKSQTGLSMHAHKLNQVLISLSPLKDAETGSYRHSLWPACPVGEAGTIQGAGRELALEMFVPPLCSQVARVKFINTLTGFVAD